MPHSASCWSYELNSKVWIFFLLCSDTRSDIIQYIFNHTDLFTFLVPTITIDHFHTIPRDAKTKDRAAMLVSYTKEIIQILLFNLAIMLSGENHLYLTSFLLHAMS